MAGNASSFTILFCGGETTAISLIWEILASSPTFIVSEMSSVLDPKIIPRLPTLQLLSITLSLATASVGDNNDCGFLRIKLIYETRLIFLISWQPSCYAVFQIWEDRLRGAWWFSGRSLKEFVPNLLKACQCLTQPLAAVEKNNNNNPTTAQLPKERNCTWKVGSPDYKSS